MDLNVTLGTAALAFIISALLGIILVPALRKLKYGQTILDIGPNWHKNKEGTPTMGGIMFIVGITIAAAVGYLLYSMRNELSPVTAGIETTRYYGAFLLALGNGFVGFMDDYVKVAKKRNLGLTASQKLIFQFAIAVAYMATLYLAGDSSTTLIVPFLGQLKLGILYYPLCVLGIVYIINSVNFTDGLDGLASTVTFTAAIGFMTISVAMGYYLNSLLAAALAGGCLGFLIWNFYPAKVFMGDTGSMFLGGMVVGLAFGVGMPLILVFVGFIYIAESLSVVLQVISFKTTGKRIFKMSPIHHHFEMLGHKETTIVFWFSFVTALGCVLALLAVKSL